MKRRHSQVVVDLNAIQHNYQLLKNNAPNSRCIAVVKADAYGHGAVQVAKALSNTIKADAFAVATAVEAVELRQAGIQQKILILGGFINEQELLLVIEHQLDCVIHSQYQIDLLLIAGNCDVNVWLKVNTGMGRLGFNLDEVTDALNQLSAFTIVSMMTHLASADDLNNTKTQLQLKNIKTLNLDKYNWSISNSAGTLGWPQSHSQWVRFGIALYGISPFNNEHKNTQQLKPAMNFKSQLVALYNRQKGDEVGYSSTYVCTQDMKIGIVGAGYADGYPRHINNTTHVTINNQLVPVIGRVSMDMITIDVSQVNKVSIGDEVTLWHNSPSAEQIAINSETIAYELCCNAGAHVDIDYINVK